MEMKGLFFFIAMAFAIMVNAREPEEALDAQERSLVRIAALTSTGNQPALKNAFNEGLDAGLSVAQINDVLAQLYAYCGFPKSLNAIFAFMDVVDDRKAKGIQDSQGEMASPAGDGDRYERGRKTLEVLTGREQPVPAPGFGEFNPTIDRFLKEHLFADIFDSDLLTYKQRELATISALSVMEGAEPQLRAHFGMGTNVGISGEEMKELLDITGELIRDQVHEPINRAELEFLKFQLAGTTAVDLEASEKHLIRISEIEIYPEYFEAYISILKEEASASVLKEPGVISIFPLVQKQDPSQIRILEFYKDLDAYRSHIASEHFQYYKSHTLHMVKDLRLIDMYLIDARTMPSIFKKLR